jgi:hypothetical protein
VSPDARKTNFNYLWLICFSYNNQNVPLIMTAIVVLDVDSNYDKFLLTGDFNVEEEENCLREFLFHYNPKNLIKGKTCFKSIDNPRCIDLLLTNSYRNFQNTTTVATGLSNFHKMAITVLKTTFSKAKPKVIQYRI